MINPVLKRLGISSEVQAFFHADHLCFDYGDASEVYGDGFHYVPTTSHLWLVGSVYAADVIVTSSAMEALAWYEFHHPYYHDPGKLAFVSLGNLASDSQLNWLRSNFKRRKFTLVFGNDFLGALTDIRVTAALKNKAVILCWQKREAEVRLNGRTACFDESCCSLYRFEQVFGLRTGIRTSKPSVHTSFLIQLQQHVK